jgi:hypothetical protein
VLATLTTVTGTPAQLNVIGWQHNVAWRHENVSAAIYF